MKKLFLLFLFTQIIQSQTRQITSFDDLINSLKNGYEVRVIADYGKCKLVIDNVEENSVNVIGGMTISTFEYFTKGSIRNEKAFIAFSEQVLISHKRYGYVFNYVKFRVYEDDKVEIIARYLRPNDFEVVMDETFYCEINNDANDGGVFFYKN